VASWRGASAWARGLFFRDRLERELDDELRFHLEKQVEENLRAGMSEAEAHRKPGSPSAVSSRSRRKYATCGASGTSRRRSGIYARGSERSG
jgi:hypothetical protein